MLEELGNTFLFEKRHYKASKTVGLPSHKMRPVQCLFHIDAGPNLVGEYFLDNDYVQVIRAVSVPPRRGATSQMAGIVRAILLHFTIGDTRTRVVYIVVRNWAVPISLLTSSIDKFAKRILPPEHRIELYNSTPVPLVATVIKAEQKKNDDKQKDETVENITVA